MIIVDFEEVEGAISYNIYRSPTGDTGTFVLQANVPTNVYNDPTGSETDFYRIAAVDVHGEEGQVSDVTHFYSLTAPSEVLDVCRVFGTVTDVNGHPDPDVEIRFEINTPDASQIVQSTGMNTGTVFANTNPDGFFEEYLVQGALVTMFIPKMRRRFQFAVPLASSIDFKDLSGIELEIENPF